jgi:hypothetical protein
MLFAIYGHKLYKFEDIQQDILSVFRKQDQTDAAKVKNMLNEMPEKDSETGRLQHTTGDPEIDKALEEAEKEQVVYINPIMQKLLNSERSDLQFIKTLDLNKRFTILRLKIKELNSLIVKVFFTTATVIFLLTLFLRKTTFSGIGLLFATLGFNFSRVIMFLTALIAAIVWFSLNYNFFVDIGSISLCSLLFLMISSAVSLKIYDYNNPIWNRMIYTVIWPIASGVIIHVF